MPKPPLAAVKPPSNPIDQLDILHAAYRNFRGLSFLMLQWAEQGVSGDGGIVGDIQSVMDTLVRYYDEKLGEGGA